METSSNLILYQRETCPYCQLVRKKLSLLNLSVLLKPVEETGSERRELIKTSGQQKVPVLVKGDVVITGSDQILKYLDETFGKGDTGPMPADDYGMRVTINAPYEQVVERTIEALKTQGFGVLTEIDLKSTLKKKIDVDIPRQLILGACNPGFAHKALGAEPDIGLLLPCNVTVRETGEGEFTVTTVNPLKLLAIAGREDMLPMANEVKEKLKAALAKLSS